MAPLQGSPLTLSSPHLDSHDKSPPDLVASSPDSESSGRSPLSLDPKRLFVGDRRQAPNRTSVMKPRSMDNENTNDLPVVIPASGHVPVLFTTKLSDASLYSQETKNEQDSSDDDTPILQKYINVTSRKYYGQNHDLPIKQQLRQRMSNLKEQQETQRIKSEQFRQRIQQERQKMSARQQSRLEKVRALDDIISASQKNQCDMSLINEQLATKILEENNKASSSSSSSVSSANVIGDDDSASQQLPTWKDLLESSQRMETEGNAEALLAELSVLKSQIGQLEKENSAREGTIHSLRELNQSVVQELHVAQTRKAEIETTFHKQILALSRDRRELIHRLVEMEKRVAAAEKAKETSELSTQTENENDTTENVDESSTDSEDKNGACSDDVNRQEGEVNTNKDSESDLETLMLKQRIQELEQGREILDSAQEALVASLMEANEKRREVEDSLAVATNELESVRAENTTLSEELASLKEEANHLSGARSLLLEELERTTTRLNNVLHHRNQLESENTSLHQSRDDNEKELADNMTRFTSQHKSIESVIHRLRAVRQLMTPEEESTDADSKDVIRNEETICDDTENSKPQWLDSALVQMDDMETSLNSCLAELASKVQPSEQNDTNSDSKEVATPKASWTKFSIKGLIPMSQSVARAVMEKAHGQVNQSPTKPNLVHL